jgi:hypothetical protein
MKILASHFDAVSHEQALEQMQLRMGGPHG